MTPTTFELTGRRKRKGGNWKRQARRALIERDGEKCAHCGVTDRLTIDHVVPLIAGGTHAQANLQLLCRACNTRKGAK